MVLETLKGQTDPRAWLDWGERELGFLERREAKGESEQILQNVLGLSRINLYLLPQVDEEDLQKFQAVVQARKQRLPLAYLLRKAPFWDWEFEIEEGVFVPRPETETLIEAFLETSGFRQVDSFRFLDLGTGSGNIALTIARLFPRSTGIGSDLSEKALRVASRNAEALGVQNQLQWVRADELHGFKSHTFDVIFSNPPYVARSDWSRLEPEVRQEPRLALEAGAEGLDFYRRMVTGLSCLKGGASLWVEVGWNQGPEVKRIFGEAGLREIRSFRDLNRIERVVSGVWGHG